MASTTWVIYIDLWNEWMVGWMDEREVVLFHDCQEKSGCLYAIKSCPWIDCKIYFHLITGETWKASHIYMGRQWNSGGSLYGFPSPNISNEEKKKVRGLGVLVKGQ